VRARPTASIAARRSARIGPGEGWAIVAALSYTAVNVILRTAAARTDPFLGSILRQLPIAALAWAVVVATGAPLFRRGNPAAMSGRSFAVLLLAGFLSFFVGNVLFFRALDEGGLGITANGAQAGVVLAGIGLSTVLLRERPRREQVVGAVVLCAGLALVALAQLSEVRSGWHVGLALAIVSGFCYATANVTMRAAQRTRPALFVTLAGTAVGGLIPLTIVVLARAGWSVEAALGGIDPGTALAVLVAGGANALALIGLARALSYADVATVNTLSSSQVLWSFVAAVLLFGEVGSPVMIAGVVCVVTGIIVAQRDGRRARGLVEAPAAAPVEALASRARE
jgi:drug/metabolite transporter (DMT)-like permease